MSDELVVLLAASLASTVGGVLLAAVILTIVGVVRDLRRETNVDPGLRAHAIGWPIMGDKVRGARRLVKPPSQDPHPRASRTGSFDPAGLSPASVVRCQDWVEDAEAFGLDDFEQRYYILRLLNHRERILLASEARYERSVRRSRLWLLAFLVSLSVTLFFALLNLILTAGR